MSTGTPSPDYLAFETAVTKALGPKWYTATPAAIGYSAWQGALAGGVVTPEPRQLDAKLLADILVFGQLIHPYHKHWQNKLNYAAGLLNAFFASESPLAAADRQDKEPTT